MTRHGSLLVHLGFLFFPWIVQSTLFGQDEGDTIVPRAQAVRQLLENFEKRLASESELQKTGLRTLERLKAAQSELANVQVSASVAAAVQQFAVSAEMESQLAEALRTPQNARTNNLTIMLPRRTRSSFSPAATTAVASTTQLNQLSASARAIVDRIQECHRDLGNIMAELSKRHAERASLIDDYWEYGDPCAVHTIAENESILRELEKIAPENEAAKMARAILLRTLGSNQHSYDECSEIIDATGIYTPLAYAVRAEIRMAEGDGKKSKSDLCKR